MYILTLSGTTNYNYLTWKTGCGILSIARDIWVHEGASAFFRGAVPRVVLSFISTAIFYTVFDHVSASLRNADTNKRKLEEGTS